MFAIGVLTGGCAERARLANVVSLRVRVCRPQRHVA
jgi:hypothetical protein